MMSEDGDEDSEDIVDEAFSFDPPESPNLLAKHPELRAMDRLWWDKYRPAGRIGSGSFGEVWKAFDSSEAIVAIKFIAPSKHMILMKQALREMKLLRLLRGHQNIVQLHEVIMLGEDIFIVQEWMMCDLDDAIQARWVGVAHARDIIGKIAWGLEYCHSHLVVHRDLKPANILLDDRGPDGAFRSVKICDFGLARVISKGQTKLTKDVVTALYRAPEIDLDDKLPEYEYSWPIDIWSLGCIGAEIALGKVLFRAPTSTCSLLPSLAKLTVQQKQCCCNR
jgi:serine/threonine protein kinase